MPNDEIDKALTHEFDDDDYIAAFGAIIAIAKERFGASWKMGIMSVASNACGLFNILMFSRPTGEKCADGEPERELVAFHATSLGVDALGGDIENDEEDK